MAKEAEMLSLVKKYEKSIGKAPAGEGWATSVSMGLYPNRFLWLEVTSKWVYLADPSDALLAAVTSAFNVYSNVGVYVYYDDNNQVAKLLIMQKSNMK